MTAGPFIISIVERKPSGRVHSLVEIIGLRLESLIPALLSGTRMAREAIIDLLKFTFNILTHYPKVINFPPLSFPPLTSLICFSSSTARKSQSLAVVMTVSRSWGSAGLTGLTGSYNESISVRLLTYEITSQSSPTASPRFQLLPAQPTITPSATPQPHHSLAPRHPLHQESTNNMAPPK